MKKIIVDLKTANHNHDGKEVMNFSLDLLTFQNGSP